MMHKVFFPFYKVSLFFMLFIKRVTLKIIILLFIFFFTFLKFLLPIKFITSGYFHFDLKFRLIIQLGYGFYVIFLGLD